MFDIRANEGQFAKEIRQHGYSGKIISFEPLTSAQKKQKNLLSFASLDSGWQVDDQSVICDYNGNIKIHIAGNSISSSILTVLEPIPVLLKAQLT